MSVAPFSDTGILNVTLATTVVICLLPTTSFFVLVNVLSSPSTIDIPTFLYLSGKVYFMLVISLSPKSKFTPKKSVSSNSSGFNPL